MNEYTEGKTCLNLKSFSYFFLFLRFYLR